nr:hypothetical protein [Mycobacterium pseudoshottsii]
MHRNVMAGGIVAVAGIALVGCSNGSGTRDVGAPASGAAAGVTVVVDGEVRPIENKVECVTAANMVFVNIGSDQDGIAATLSAGDTAAVKDLTLGTIDGVPLTYSRSSTGPKPAVTKTGSTYKIVGTATGPEPGGPETVSMAFDIEFTCPPKR